MIHDVIPIKDVKATIGFQPLVIPGDTASKSIRL